MDKVISSRACSVRIYEKKHKNDAKFPITYLCDTKL